MDDSREINDPIFIGKERRRALRIKGILVKMKLRNSNNQFRGVYLRDLSLVGASITAPFKLAVGDNVEMELLLTDTKNPAYAHGQVRWVEESQEYREDGISHYDVGIEMTQMSDANAEALRNYMQMHEDNQR